jgi:hypothetical protein
VRREPQALGRAAGEIGGCGFGHRGIELAARSAAPATCRPLRPR